MINIAEQIPLWF